MPPLVQRRRLLGRKTCVATSTETCVAARTAEISAIFGHRHIKLNACCHLAAGISCKMLIDRGMWGGVSGLCLEVFPEDTGVVLFEAFGAIEAAGCCAGRV